MKREIDLDKAGEAEVFGALAVGHRRKQRAGRTAELPFTAAQTRALSEIARSFIQIAKAAGARHGRIKLGGISFELREENAEEVLSIRTAAAA